MQGVSGVTLVNMNTGHNAIVQPAVSILAVPAFDMTR
jgi:hypothetical protein